MPKTCSSCNRKFTTSGVVGFNATESVNWEGFKPCWTFLLMFFVGILKGPDLEGFKACWEGFKPCLEADDL